MNKGKKEKKKMVEEMKEEYNKYKKGRKKVTKKFFINCDIQNFYL